MLDRPRTTTQNLAESLPLNHRPFFWVLHHPPNDFPRGGRNDRNAIVDLGKDLASFGEFGKIRGGEELV